VLRNAMLAFDAGYAYPIGDIGTFNFEEGEHKDEHRLSTDGNTLMTMGLIAAGVRYGSAYPITPWSSIMETLRSELPKYGGIYVQAEDELAAVSMTIGAAFAGHLAVTGSAGPGLSLKMEALSYASMAEIPLIVINVQRGGPSTGLPTSVEQSDLLQAIYGSHGDCPRIVLAPQDVEDCFYIALEAGRLAREYSCPVIILSDQALSSRIEAFTEPDLDKCWVEPGARPLGSSRRLQTLPAGRRHPPRSSGIQDAGRPLPARHRPRARRMGPSFRQSEDAPEDDRQASQQAHRTQQEAAAAGNSTASRRAMSFSSAGAAPMARSRKAVNRLIAEGHKVGAIHIRHVHPMPANLDQHLREVQKGRRRRNERLRHVWLRPARHDASRQPCRSKDPVRLQNRRPQLPHP
jgi:2-oxoglutarate ferredoxin oxidoreductase subunit alpha